MILLLTDLHWGIKRFSHDKYKEQIDYFRNVIFPYILDNDIKEVIHCGDLVEEPIFIDNRLLQDLKQDFIGWFESNQVNLYLPTGNHDIFLKNQTSYNFNKIVAFNMKYIHEVSEIKNITIDKNNISFVPYSKSFDDIEYIQPNFIVGHHDLANVTFNIHQKSTKGLSPDDLSDKFKCPIVLGHYHNQSITRNCRYLGTLYQHTWGEFGFKKGFWTYESGEFTFHDSDGHFPKHIKIEYIQEGKKQPTFKITDGIDSEIATTDYNLIRKLVEKNIVELKAENYTSEVKYSEMVSDLASIAYTEIVINNNKKLNKAIEQLLEIECSESGEDEVGVTDSTILELCKKFFGLLPDTLENKQEMEKIFFEKMGTL